MLSMRSNYEINTCSFQPPCEGEGDETLVKQPKVSLVKVILYDLEFNR